MIGGIIVLTLFLTALLAMIVLTQQYDTYQSFATQIEREYANRFTEKLVGTYPGIANLSPDPVQGTNQYTLLITNVAGVESQIARIYINANSGVRPNPCSPGPCILNPSESVVPNTFNSVEASLNPGEFSHRLDIWLPTSMIMLGGTNGDPPGSYQFTLVTLRGAVFSFFYPFPPQGGVGGGSGGTGIYIGPLLIKFEPSLISVTNSTVTIPPNPIPGGWNFPFGSKSPVIFYIKVYSQGINPVTLTADSQFQAQAYGSPSAFQNFYIVAPMDLTYCETNLGGDTNPGNPTTLDCRSSYNGGNTYPGAPPLSGNQVILYSLSQHPYIVYPNATTPGTCCGKPVYLLFSTGWGAGAYNGVAQYLKDWYSGKGGPIATYLSLGFEYDDGTGQGPYIWGVNLPFISACEGSCAP